MTPSTITEAEQVAEQQAGQAIRAARDYAKSMVKVLAPIARSPLFGNGLHRGLVGAVENADALDDALEKLEKALHEHFHGGDKGC